MYDFPKSQMTIRELMAIGYRRPELREAYGAKGQRFARKLNPSKRNSPIVFDTDGLKTYLEKKAEAASTATHGGRRVI